MNFNNYIFNKGVNPLQALLMVILVQPLID